MMELLQRIIVRWAIKKIKKEATSDKNYTELKKWFVADIIENKITGEAMYIFD